MSEDRVGPYAEDQVYLKVQRFLSREAALLDDRRYQEWFALTTPDIRYRVLAQVSRDARVGELAFAFMDENTGSLQARVDQISTPKLTHAENPPTLTRRFVSGLEVWQGTPADELIVRSSILVYRNRPGGDEGVYSGERRDLLRVVEGDLRLAGREVKLDHVLLHGPVSTLF